MMKDILLLLIVIIIEYKYLIKMEDLCFSLDVRERVVDSFSVL